MVTGISGAAPTLVPTTETGASPPPPPPSLSACAAGEYLARYFANATLSGSLALERCEAAPLAHFWGSGSPAPAVPVDNFSGRWVGTFSFAAGAHEFTAATNDGMRVWVDGALLIDRWFDQAATTYQATRTLAAGEHEVKVDHYESAGTAVAQLSWRNLDLPPPPPGSEPGPIAGQGYAVTFEDDFSALNRDVWCNRQWYEEQPPANAQYILEGVLHVVSRRSQGYANASVSSEPCGQATPRSFRNGYFESRFRWTRGNGSSPAFWLFSTTHATNPNWPSPACPGPECLSGEIDVFEGQGREPGVYLGTIHRNSCGCYGVPNQQRQGVARPVGMDLTAGFHTYAVLWTPAEVKWYLDGALLGSVSAFDSTDQPMHLIFYQWPQSWTRDPDATSPDELHIEVDWVRVWQR